MPWTRAQTDIETALFGLQVEVTHAPFEVRIDIHDVDPAEVHSRLSEMFRALSKFSKKCEYSGGCAATLHFIVSTKRDGSPTQIPVRSIRTADGLAFIVRNHFKDCPGLAKRDPQPSQRTPEADNPTGGRIVSQKPPERPKQTSLFDMNTGYGPE
jgi:hypothetical protein